MHTVKTLVLMQLKEKLNKKGRNKSVVNTIQSVVFTILKFALITAFCFGLLWVCKFLQLFSLFVYLPISILVVVFAAMLIISTISCTISLDKALYFSNDNPLLLTLPAKPTQVFLSKIIVFYIFELIRNFTFMVPFFIISGIFACLIIYELRKMIKSVEQENCFIYENVISLKRMGNYSFIIAVVSFGRLFLYSTPGVLVVILVFVIAGLFSKVLSNVFETAVQYKEDNDLTI